MILSGLLSFLGGNVFRMIWGEISHFISQKQEHTQEIERMKLQGELDAAAHGRNMEALKLQSELGVKLIEVQSNADKDKLDVGAWADAVGSVGRSTGIAFIDIWNGSIRPALASMSMLMVVAQFIHPELVVAVFIQELIGAILGIYVADRSLAHRGK